MMMKTSYHLPDQMFRLEYQFELKRFDYYAICTYLDSQDLNKLYSEIWAFSNISPYLTCLMEDWIYGIFNKKSIF